MYTFDGRHYVLQGYKSVVIDGRGIMAWVFHDKTSTIIMHEAKFVSNGNVYFLKPDGTYETRALVPLEFS